MIHYDLQCAVDHRFDGWFRDSAAFDSQSERGLLECPLCGERRVTRALMAPSLPKRRRALAPPAGPAPAADQPKAEGPGTALAPVAVPASVPSMPAGGALPDQVRAVLQRLRAEVERRCDYVGDTFADEARRIHRGETDPRGIYGETTPDEAEALVDEGIVVNRIPWVPRADG